MLIPLALITFIAIVWLVWQWRSGALLPAGRAPSAEIGRSSGAASSSRDDVASRLERTRRQLVADRSGAGSRLRSSAAPAVKITSFAP